MVRKVFTGIEELVTLSAAAHKDARRPLEGDLSIVRDAAMVSQDGKIVWVGPRKDLVAPVHSELVALNARTVLPSFVECHTHLIFAGNRAHEFEWRMQGQTYQEIAAKGGGIRFTVDQTRKASREELRHLAQGRTDRFVSQGVTTLEVKSGYGLDLDTELLSLAVARELKGPRIVTTYLGAHSRSPDFADLDQYLAEICEVILPQVARAKLADRADIYVEEGFFTNAQAEKYLATAKSLGLQLTGHVEQLSEMGGAETLLNFEPRSVDHLVFINDSTIKRIARSSTTAVLLPASDFYLRMAYPRARALIDAGARVALSTDFNPGTSPTQDLSLVGVLARLEMKMTAVEVLVALTLGGAHALGVAHDSGSLEVGKACDFSVLPCEWNELFYSVGSHPVTSVYRSGEQISQS